jgi:hypothetical protein
MSRYNHFSKKEYSPICFGQLEVGEKFRNDFFTGKRRRKDIVCIKTGDLSYKELKSGRDYKVFSSAFDVAVY